MIFVGYKLLKVVLIYNILFHILFFSSFESHNDLGDWK